MGLHIGRNDGESITLDCPDGRQYLLDRQGRALVCYKSSTPKGRRKILWRRLFKVGERYVIDHEMDVYVRKPNQNTATAWFIVSAPFDVTISRTEDLRTIEDRLKAEAGNG